MNVFPEYSLFYMVSLSFFPPFLENLKLHYNGKVRKHTSCFIRVHYFFLYMLTQRMGGTLQILTKGSMAVAGRTLKTGLSVQFFYYQDNCLIENSSLEKFQLCVWITTGCWSD